MKFRAYDRETKKIFKVSRLDFLEWCVCVEVDVDLYVCERNSFKNEVTDRFILIRFVGLHDENGLELDWWEGDIFARTSDRQIVGSIIYDLGCFWLDRTDTGERIALHKCMEWQMYKVGNIYEEAK